MNLRVGTTAALVVFAILLLQISEAQEQQRVAAIATVTKASSDVFEAMKTIESMSPIERRKALEVNDCDGSNDENPQDKGGKYRLHHGKRKSGKIRGKSHQGSSKRKGHSSKAAKGARTARSERVREWEQSIFDEIFQIASDFDFSLDYGRGS